jgi:hypothetical protein
MIPLTRIASQSDLSPPGRGEEEFAATDFKPLQRPCVSGVTEGGASTAHTPLIKNRGGANMRIALILAMISILGVVAVGRLEARKDASALPIEILKVRVVKDPVITADMLSPRLTMPPATTESTVASLEAR